MNRQAAYRAAESITEVGTAVSLWWPIIAILGRAGVEAASMRADSDSYWHSYRYDKSGNRTEFVRHGLTGDTSHRCVYPAAGSSQPHTVTRIDTSGAACTDSVACAYNTAGNLISGPDGSGGTQTFTWNVEGHRARAWLPR